MAILARGAVRCSCGATLGNRAAFLKHAGLDTPQQARILRTNHTARYVRAKFPAGTRVASRAGVTGTVTRHVPGTNAQGGYIVVAWDNGRTGRHSACALQVVNP